MSKYENSINKHNTFLQKIIQEASKSNGKNVIEMSNLRFKTVNELSMSVLQDIDNLKTVIKKPEQVTNRQENIKINESLVYNRKKTISERTLSRNQVSTIFARRHNEAKVYVTEESSENKDYINKEGFINSLCPNLDTISSQSGSFHNNSTQISSKCYYSIVRFLIT